MDIRHLLSVALLMLPLVCAKGQAPSVPIEGPGSETQNTTLLEKLAALREKGGALSAAGAKAALDKPTPAPVALPPHRTTALRSAEVWQAAQRSRIRIGWYYLCHKCDHWHINLAGGYPVTADGVIATCYHVTEPGPEVREGCLVAVDSADAVYPITAVLARSRTMDACLLRAGGLKTDPLPLNDHIHPGDPAFLLSTPLETSGYFSTGTVNRFYWNPKTAQGFNPEGQDALKHLRLNVSTDWAPGSSGSPVLDNCGNAIGHVAVISHLGDGKNSNGKGVAHITLHEAVPARSVRWLAEQASRPVPAQPLEPSLARVREALESRDHTVASKLADELEKAGVPDADKPGLSMARFHIALAAKNESAATTSATVLADGPVSSNGPALNEVAWKLVTLVETPQPATLEAVEKIARRSVELQLEKDAASLDTLARVRFLQDKKDEAIQFQEKAVSAAPEPLKPSLQKTLEDYRAGKVPPAAG